jgi:branched-chain amino acid transport system substrate-binding protein
MSVPRLASLVGALSLSVLALLSGCGDHEPIAIGYIGGLSGHAADLGLTALNGVRLAIEAQNERGGIDGHPILLLPEDDQQNDEAARAAFDRLAARHVAAIIGPVTSAMAVTLVPLADRDQILLLSPTVTTRDLAGRDDQFIRVIADTGQYAKTSARFQAERRHLRSFAVLYDANNQAYADSWAGDFADEFQRLGGTVVARIAFRSTAAADYAGQALRAKESGADAILILGSAADTALMCQQIRLLDDKIPLVTSEWAATERFVTLGGQAVEGVFTSQFVDRDSLQPAYIAYRKLFLERFQQEPGFAGIAGHDAAEVLITALQRRRRGESLRDAIIRLADFQGLQNHIHIDRFGDSSRPTYLTVIRNGKFIAID